MKQQSNTNTYIGIAVALLVAGFMFYGASFLYSNVINNNQDGTASVNNALGTDNTMSDLKTEVVVSGNGDVAENGDRVFVNYTGTLTNGTKFDSSYDRGEDGKGVPIDFILGTGQVIAGWDQGIIGMKVGEKKHLTIPPELGYGARGSGPIPPNSTLLFDVELVKVEKTK